MAITECRFDAAAPFHLTVVFRLPLLVKTSERRLILKDNPYRQPSGKP
jgi:hypothetical protein